MNRSHARQLAKTIKNQEVFDMLQKAKSEITDWEKPTKCNAHFSRGKFWNMFHCAEFDVEKEHHEMILYRYIEEFGEFLPEKFQPVKKKKYVPEKIWHEDPKF